MNQKVLSVTLAAAISASLMQTAVFAASPTRAEALRTVVNLPDVRITENSHFMFREKNSEEIASHVENWIKENVEQ